MPTLDAHQEMKRPIHVPVTAVQRTDEVSKNPNIQRHVHVQLPNTLTMITITVATAHRALGELLTSLACFAFFFSLFYYSFYVVHIHILECCLNRVVKKKNKQKLQFKK